VWTAIAFSLAWALQRKGRGGLLGLGRAGCGPKLRPEAFLRRCLKVEVPGPTGSGLLVGVPFSSAFGCGHLALAGLELPDVWA